MYVHCTDITHTPLMLLALFARLFFPFVGSFPSPASLPVSSPPPHLHRHVFNIFGTLRGECNTIQSVAEHLPALPSNISDISASLLKTNSSVYVHCKNIACTPLMLVAHPTVHMRRLQFLQFLVCPDNGTQRAEHMQVRMVWLHITHLVRGTSIQSLCQCPMCCSAESFQSAR